MDALNNWKCILVVLGLLPLVSWCKNPQISAREVVEESNFPFVKQVHQEPVEDRIKSFHSRSFKTTHEPTYHKPPEYIINLDLLPEKRWTQVAKDYKYRIPQLIEGILQVVPEELKLLLEKVAGLLEKKLRKEYAAELRGMAAEIGINTERLILVNALYDITAHCTSIVAQDSSGQIWHARNFDYDFTQTLKNLTINVSFQRDGKTVYKVTTFPGYVGIITGQKANKFTISVNQRSPGTPLWLNWLMMLLDSKTKLVSFAVREAFEGSESFAQTVKMLSVVHTAAPVYYIIAGVNSDEGAVITKDRIKPADVWYLDTEDGRWYLVETNYDHWKPPPQYDNRRDPAIQAMNNTGQGGINTEAFFDILHLPNVRQLKTVYTTVMSATQPEIYTTHVLAQSDTEV